jgi:transcriptional regulator with XRE-family HTH domain
MWSDFFGTLCYDDSTKDGRLFMDALETGKRIQSLRKQRGWTQKELAQRLCVSDKAVSKWERGLNYPDMSILEPLAKALDTSVADILCIESEQENQKVEIVTAIAAKETERIRKEICQRALICMMNGLILIISQFVLYYLLWHRYEVYDTLPRVLTIGMSSFSGTLVGNALWIWWKHRK